MGHSGHYRHFACGSPTHVGRLRALCAGVQRRNLQLPLELAAQLPDYPFRSHSDTEVILAGFTTWGPAFLPQLNGIFAFIIYDKLEGLLYAVRDRFGIKPLYYTHQASTGLWAFASEQRALLAGGFAGSGISQNALCDYLWNGAVSGDQRMLADVQEVPAGHYLLLRLVWVLPSDHFGASPIRSRPHRRRWILKRYSAGYWDCCTRP